MSRRLTSRRRGDQSPGRLSRRARLAGLAVATALVACGGAVAHAAGVSPVVPPGGTIDGEGYAYWSGAADAAFFDSGGATPPCARTLKAPDGGTVVELAASGSCDVPAWEPIFVPGDGANYECSTVEGDHYGFGTTPAQLQLCARQNYYEINTRGTATVDGNPVENYAGLISASPAFDFVIPDRNDFGVTPGPGMTAIYGESLLLRGLSPGTHTIRITAAYNNKEMATEYTLHVH